jgi:hypothetical protein
VRGVEVHSPFEVLDRGRLVAVGLEQAGELEVVLRAMALQPLLLGRAEDVADLVVLALP